MKNNDKSSPQERIIIAKEKTIGEFFKDVGKKIVIPPNQRPYSWEKVHVEAFLEDLIETREKKNNYKHYFNMITFFRNNEEIGIYDGQQRVTTTYITMLLYFKVYSYLVSKREKEIRPEDYMKDIKSKINEYKKYIVYKDEKKLELYDRNEEMLKIIYDTEYNNKIQFLEDINNSMVKNNICTKSNLRLESAVKNILSIEKVRGLGKDFDLSQNNPDDEVLKVISEFLDVLINNFEVIVGEISKLNNAYKIFELVNHRGQKLSDFDLVKNYFYQVINTSGLEKDLNKLNELIETMFTTLGDDVEDAITKHWLMFFNDSTTKEHGKFKKIYTSIQEGIDYKKRVSKNHTKEPRIPAKKRELVFNFLQDMCDNIESIDNYYKFINMSANDFCDEINIDKFEKRGLRYECLKRIFTFYSFCKDYDYVDFYLYYMMIEKQNETSKLKNCKISDEFKKVVAFYLTNSIVTQNNMTVLEDLNTSLGNKFKECFRGNKIDFDVNLVLAQGMLSKNEIRDNVTNRNFERKLTMEEKDRKGDVLKLLFAFIYDNEKFSSGIDIFKRFYTWNSEKNMSYVIEEEHVFPTARTKENFADRFGMDEESSKLRERVDWLGNKLVLEKGDNIHVGTVISKKIECYVNTNNEVTTEYAKIFTNIILDKEYTKDDLRGKLDNIIGEINKKIDYKYSKENMETALKIEEEWRCRIGKWFDEYDLLGLNKLLNTLAKSSEKSEG